MTGAGLYSQISSGNKESYNTLTSSKLKDFLNDLSSGDSYKPRTFEVTCGFIGMIHFDIFNSLLESEIKYWIYTGKKSFSIQQITQISLTKKHGNYKILVIPTDLDEELNRPYLVKLMKGTILIKEFNSIKEAALEYSCIINNE